LNNFILNLKKKEETKMSKFDAIEPSSSSWTDEFTGDHVSLTLNPIDVGKMTNLARSDQAGALSSFLGTTRDNFEGKVVTHLSYESYNDMAIAAMKNMCKSIRSKWSVIKIIIEHKLGDCPIGEISVFIAISSEHRTESLDAVSFAINDLKSSVPIWKKEHYDVGGSSWKSNKEFEPIDSTQKEIN
jgi:molybdopterin synthase catalytic subunit